MNFEQLRIFIAVVDQRSFTKAAETLYISHSTTSRNVSALEEDLGVRLLSRDNRSVRLTTAGEVLYREGVKLLKKVEAIEGSVRNAGLGRAGKLNIASVNLYSYELWTGYKAFCKAYPEVVLGMYHRDLEEIWEQVSSGEADVGVTFSYALPEDTADFCFRTISHAGFCAVMPVEHPLAVRGSVRLEELLQERYISLPEMNFHFIKDPLQREMLNKAAQDWAVVPTVESLFLQIRSGNGLSMVPYPVAFEHGSNCATVALEGADTEFDVVMFWREDNLNPSLPLFLETIRKDESR